MVAVILKELNHLRKYFIIIQNTDNKKCLIWCLARSLYPMDKNLVRDWHIENIDINMAIKVDFKEIKFPVKTRDKMEIKKIRKKLYQH